MKTPRALILFGCLILAVASLVRSALADISVGSDGSDGSLYVTSNTVIDLSKAATATWNTPSPVSGKGVYDPQQWAVVFKYDSVYIAPGVTVSFTNNASSAPVVWLAQHGVAIQGNVSLNGRDGTNDGVPASPGPGGFRGGKSGSALTGASGGAGMGPGGGQYGDQVTQPFPGYSITNEVAGSAGYGTVGSGGIGSVAGGGVYGSPQVVPLIGGSGGGGLPGSHYGGGAGGGALMIASSQTVTVAGTITVNGGATALIQEGNLYLTGGCGSGGAIRIVADRIAGAGSLSAVGGAVNVPSGPSSLAYRGGDGRIRVEANTTSFGGGSAPVYSLHLPIGSVPAIWPPNGSPSVSISAVGGKSTPTDPTGSLFGGDLQISSASAVLVTLSATNVPSNATMTLRAVLVAGGRSVSVNATLASGDQTASTWTATLPAIPNNGYTLLQAHVTLP